MTATDYAPTNFASANYARARRNMVDCQLLTNQVTNPALVAAMGEIPRESFVPAGRRSSAYVDEDIPLGRGRFVTEPMVLARLLQAAEVRPGDRVLDIGCATGYSTAVLARLAKTVVAVECDPALAAQARDNLAALRAANAGVVEGKLESGHPALAPYDLIFIGGSIERLPRALTDQLAFGGRIAAVMAPEAGSPGGARARSGEAVLFKGRPPTRVPLFDAASPVLPGFAAEPGFVF